MQQDVEPASAKAPANVPVRGGPPALVEDDELHALKTRQQCVLDAPDDPGQFGPRPRPLNGPHHRHGVAGVADGGQAEDADPLRR